MCAPYPCCPNDMNERKLQGASSPLTHAWCASVRARPWQTLLPQPPWVATRESVSQVTVSSVQKAIQGSQHRFIPILSTWRCSVCACLADRRTISEECAKACVPRSFVGRPSAPVQAGGIVQVEGEVELFGKGLHSPPCSPALDGARVVFLLGVVGQGAIVSVAAC